MKLFKKIICGVLSVSVLLSCIVNTAFAENEFFSAELSETEVPAEKKTIYNFNCKETSMKLSKTEIIGDERVAFYQGYETSLEKNFTVSNATFPAFDHGVVFKREKGAANNVTYTRPAYGNNGSLYDGLNGREYFMSFDITTDAIVYMVDRENKGWPSRPDDWFVAGKIGSYSVFGKHFEAGQKVEVPCYGWDDAWDKTAMRLFMDPGYYVVAWDNDVTLESFSYSLDSAEYINVDGFNETDNGGEYDVSLVYKKNGYDIDLSLIPNDEDATVTVIDGQENLKLTYGNSVSVSYLVESEAGDESAVYTVNYTMEPKKNTNISVNPAIASFGAGNEVTDIYEAEYLAGDTTVQNVPIASYDEKGYFKCAQYKVVYIDDGEEKTAYVDYKDIYNYMNSYEVSYAAVSQWKYTDEDMYTINKGGAFFTDEGSFGVTGSAYDKMNHVMTSSQLAPGKVKAESFSSADKAAEFKNWLLNDENYAYSITPTNNCVVYMAFTQAKSKNHTKFINDGWTFNDYSGITIPENAILDEFKDYSSYKWWMAEPSYNYNGYPFLLIKNQYAYDAATVSRNYYYIWSKEVKAGERVEIPVGGSAFSSGSDQNAPKMMFIWQDNLIRDDVSGEFLIGKRNLPIDNSFETRPLPTMVASIGDSISFNSKMGATAEFSETIVQKLPCVIEATVTSEAGTSVSYSINIKRQPQITSVNVSEQRSKFVANTDSNEIKLSPYLAGELTLSTPSRQVFEQDENGVLQPVYGSDGKYVYERVERYTGSPFYRDRTQHKFCHVGQGFRNLQYFWIPSNDSISRRRNVYISENTKYMEKNGGQEKIWEYVNEDGVKERLNYSEMLSRYEDYVLGENEYFNFTADGDGVVYVALDTESANFNISKGWKHMSVEVPIPQGHIGWNSVEAEVTNVYYPYQLGKIQYDAHATEYQSFSEIYYKPFKADEVVSIPTTGIAGSNVCAVMIGWEDFVTDSAGGVLTYGKNSVNVRNNKEKYTLNVYAQEDFELSYKPAYEYSRVTLSDTKVKISELPKTVTIKVVNAFGAEKEFEIEFIKGRLGDKKVYNFDTSSEYSLYESEETGVYNTDKGFIKFSEGLYMLEENLERGVSSYYSDRLTHKFTKENTSEMFEGATYIRRPKKSSDYGNMGLSGTSAFYNDEAYSGRDSNGYWINFGISSAADVYVGVPGDGIWPNKPDDWQEVTDENVKLAGCTKIYMKSCIKGEFVGIPSMGWYSGWENTRTSWDLPVYVVVWK